RGLDDPFAALGRRDRVVVRHRRAAGVADLLHRLIRHIVTGAGAVRLAPEVVDDDLGAAAPHVERVGLAEPAAGPRDDDDAVVESYLAHACSPFSVNGCGWTSPASAIATQEASGSSALRRGRASRAPAWTAELERARADVG